MTDTATVTPTLTPDEYVDMLDTLDDASIDSPRTWENEAKTVRVTATVEADYDVSINDYECYGRADRYSHDWTDGRVDRPDGFDGFARKISVDRGSWIWWQPPDDFKSAKAWGGDPASYDKAFSDFVDLVTDLLRWGFRQVGVRTEVRDVCGHYHAIDDNWLGGVDSLDNGYLRDLITDLVAVIPEEGTE